MRLKRMMQGAGFVYVLLLLGAVCPSLFTIGKQAEGEAPGTTYANASAYVADSIMEKPKIAITFDDGPSAVYTPPASGWAEGKGCEGNFLSDWAEHRKGRRQ